VDQYQFVHKVKDMSKVILQLLLIIVFVYQDHQYQQMLHQVFLELASFELQHLIKKVGYQQLNDYVDA
jgi:hypothetical protein